MPERRKHLPHLLLRLGIAPSPFSSLGSGAREIPPARNRAMHAALLERRLLEAEQGILQRAVRQAATGASAAGTYVEFSGEPGHALKLKSLDARSRGIEVVAVREEFVQAEAGSLSFERATVFVPHGELKYFVEKVSEYATRDTVPRRPSQLTKPKNEALVASISDVQLAVLVPRPRQGDRGTCVEAFDLIYSHG